jgi:hypothetical protein
VLVSAFLTRGLCADLLRLVLMEHILVTSEVVLADRRFIASLPAFFPNLLGALIRHRGDKPQAERLEQWLAEVLQTYSDRLLHLDCDNFASCEVRLLNPFQAC